MSRVLLDGLAWIGERLAAARRVRRFARLRALGMHIGVDVVLPDSVWIDWSHCYLIRIGDHCRIGEASLILAHDAQMDEFLDAGRIGRVILHDRCVIGARTVILPGVEIGPRTIVAPNSVVVRSLAPDSVCAGSPARVVQPLAAYLEEMAARIATGVRLDRSRYKEAAGRAALADDVRAAAEQGDVFLVDPRRTPPGPEA